MDVVSIVDNLKYTFNAKTDDDFSDRLNYRYTVGFLIIFAIILTTRQYTSTPIQCWVPAHFTRKLTNNSIILETFFDDYNIF
jgi:hypothetical protein